MPVFPETPIDPGEPGAEIVPYGYEFRGFRFGSGTDYITEEVDGLLGSATSRDQDQDKSNDHGVNPGILLFGKRIIAFNMKVIGAPGEDIEQKLENLNRIFQPPARRKTRELSAFIFQRPGAPKKVIYARCTKRDFTSSYNVARGLAEGSVELQAPDPLIYSLAVNDATVILPGGSTSDSTILLNDGDHEDGSSPVFTISGPSTNPVITNQTDENRQFKLNVVLDANDSVRVDFKNRQIEVSRDGDPYEKDFTILAPDSRWWVLVPGLNTVSYNRGGGNAGATSTLTIEWQDVWQ